MMADMPVAVAAGVDTWSPCWTIDVESTAAGKMAELAVSRSARGSWLLPGKVDEHRVGWFPGPGLIFAEGHPEPGRLARPDDLHFAFDRLTAALMAAGLPIPEGTTRRCTDGSQRPGFAGLRRLDGTVDLACATRSEGFAVMAAVAAVATSAPRIQANVFFGHASPIETVLWRGHRSGKILGRFYDKGLESGRARPGMLLRPEDQRRWQKAGRPTLEGARTEHVRENFRKRFEVLHAASKGVVVGPVTVLAERLNEMVDSGEIPARKAENLAGYLVLQATGATGRLERTTRWRREKDLRDLGLVPEHYVPLLAEQLEEDRGTEIELRPVLEECLETDRWEQEPAELLPGQMILGSD
jgi:hypothetical protein